jgi:signal transduction histidine kinase
MTPAPSTSRLDASHTRVLFVGPPDRGRRLAEHVSGVSIVSHPALGSGWLTGVDCVVVEHAPPTYDGFETVRTLHETHPDCHTVFLADAAYLADAIAAGATEFVRTGPASLDSLAARVERALHVADERPDGPFPPLDTLAPAEATPAVAARQSNLDNEQLTAAMAHDLRQSLRMVTCYLELLDRQYGSRLPEEAVEFLGYASSGADRMDRLVDDLLRYTRAGHTAPSAAVPLRRVVATALDTHRPRVETTDAVVVVGDLPTVAGDENQLVQLFENLLGNALTYTDGRPTVVVDAREHGDTWQVVVTDDGFGMTAGEVAHAFDPFVRLHEDEVPEGTGLGLAICRRIATTHGGTVHVDSAPGVGTAVVVTLPKTRDDETV